MRYEGHYQYMGKVYKVRMRRAAAVMISLVLCFLLTSCSMPGLLRDTELYFAVTSGNLERIKEAVDNGADINRASMLYALHECPLLYSVQYGQRCIPEYLLSAGADPNYIDDSNGISILMYAVGAHTEVGITYSASTRNDVYKILLKDQRTVVNLTGRLGYTALDYACRYNGRLRIVEDLLDHGARVSATTIELAVKGCSRRHCDESVVKLIYFLLREQETPFDIDPEIEAAILADSDTLIALIHTDKVKQENVQIVMLMACAFGNVEAVKALAEANTDFFGDSPEGTHWGNICLAAACSYGNLEIVEYLVNEHIDVDVLAVELFTLQRRSPLTFALQNNHLDIADYLFSLGAELQIADSGTSGNRPDVLEITCENGHMDAVKWILEHGYPLDEERLEKTMVRAAWYDQIDILDYFLTDLGAEINAEYHYSTVLTDSITDASFETIKFLVDNGAQVNGGKDRVFTPINRAVNYNRVDVLLYLIEKGADIDFVGCADIGYRPSRPLTTAIQNGYFEIVQILVENGADLNYSEGWTDGQDTPLEIAKRARSQRIITYIENALS